jgi:stage IV sporulation protein FB
MKIEFHYTYIITAFGFIITGYFSNLLIFTSIILIHELGHFIMAKLNRLNVDKIILYPYGGLLKMNNPINISINKELLVAISGILFQTIYYCIICILYNEGIIRDYIYDLYKMYNYSILTFNLLPIHPLDGSKILTLLLTKFLPFNTSNKINILISTITLITIFIINYYSFNYTFILIVGVLVDNIIKYIKDLKYIFNKFLLERYLYKMSFKKTKKINKITNMYKDKYHILKENNQYITEKQALTNKFKGKT